MFFKKKYGIGLTVSILPLLAITTHSFLTATESQVVVPTGTGTLTKDQAHSEETWITVFVHGIMSIKPHLSTDNFFRLLRDDVQDSLYATTIEFMRNDPVFYKNQAMQMPGLHPAYPDEVRRGNASGALAFSLNSLENHYGIAPAKNYYYTFGWSGLLSSTTRFNDAHRLFLELQRLTANFRAQGIEPKLRLYGYSHGGNVLLNLAAVRRELYPHADLKVAELSLWGTPIQNETDHLITDPMFGHVFHHYSEKDRVQWADFFSSGTGGFSSQKFKNRRGFELPDKLTQIKVKIMRPSDSARKNPKKFELSANFNNKAVLLGRSHLLRDNSPGHVELWFFPWTPSHYRESYTLHPFPTVAYSPVIDYYAKQIKDKKPHHIITADIRPEHGVMLIRREASADVHHMLPLPSKEKVASIKEELYAYAPKKYTTQLYDKHTKIAYYKAREKRSTYLQPRRVYGKKRKELIARHYPNGLHLDLSSS